MVPMVIQFIFGQILIGSALHSCYQMKVPDDSWFWHALGKKMIMISVVIFNPTAINMSHFYSISKHRIIFKPLEATLGSNMTWWYHLKVWVFSPLTVKGNGVQLQTSIITAYFSIVSNTFLHNFAFLTLSYTVELVKDALNNIYFLSIHVCLVTL